MPGGFYLASNSPISPTTRLPSNDDPIILPNGQVLESSTSVSDHCSFAVLYFGLILVCAMQSLDGEEGWIHVDHDDDDWIQVIYDDALPPKNIPQAV